MPAHKCGHSALLSLALALVLRGMIDFSSTVKSTSENCFQVSVKHYHGEGMSQVPGKNIFLRLDKAEFETGHYP